MIDLSSEPRLGSVVLTKNATFKKVWRLPRGMTFPAEATAALRISDRDGGSVLVEFSGDVGTNTVTFKEDAEAHDDIPAGANFELFITIPDDGTYKVEYGRVVRRDPFRSIQ